MGAPTGRRRYNYPQPIPSPPGSGGGSSSPQQIQLTGNDGFPDPLEGWRFSEDLSSVSGTRNLTGSALTQYFGRTYSGKASYFNAAPRRVTSPSLRILGDKTFLAYVEIIKFGSSTQVIMGCGGDGTSLAESYLYQIEINLLGEISYAHQTGFGPAAFYRHNAPAIVNIGGSRYDYLTGVVGFINEGSESRLVYNGRIVSTDTFATAPSGGSNADFSIGVDAGFSTAYLNGLLGEAWIWDVALSSEEVLNASRSISPMGQ